MDWRVNGIENIVADNDVERLKRGVEQRRLIFERENVECFNNLSDF